MTRRTALRGLAVAAAVALWALPSVTSHHRHVQPVAVVASDLDRAGMVTLDEQRASRRAAALLVEPTTTEPTTTTTTTAPQPVPTTAKPAPPPTTTPPSAAPVQAGGLNWAALRQCENSGRYTSSSGDYYRGAYQFDRGTWDGVLQRMADGWDGDSGENPWAQWVGVDPAGAPPEVQDAAALHLFGESGRSPWPRCGARL